MEPGNKNRRLNTSLLIRYHGPSGRRNILIDVGKYVTESSAVTALCFHVIVLLIGLINHDFLFSIIFMVLLYLNIYLIRLSFNFYSAGFSTIVLFDGFLHLG